jgi:hypothetical protein
MTAREFTLTFELRKNYLYAHITGRDSFSASLDYWKKIADKVRKLDLSNVLVHENLMGDVSEGEMFEIMMKVLPSSTGIKIAFYDENTADENVNDLGQLIANNRGADICIFQTLEAAEKWLEED